MFQLRLTSTETYRPSIGCTPTGVTDTGLHVNLTAIQRGRLKLQDRKMQDWKMTDKSAGLENAGLEIDGQKLQGVENDGHSIKR